MESKIESKELVAAPSVHCRHLQEVRGSSNAMASLGIEALVQSFKDGSTRVLCDNLNNGDCKSSRKPCTFVVGKAEEE